MADLIVFKFILLNLYFYNECKCGVTNHNAEKTFIIYYPMHSALLYRGVLQPNVDILNQSKPVQKTLRRPMI